MEERRTKALYVYNQKKSEHKPFDFEGHLPKEIH